MRPGAHVPWFNPREMDDETVLMLNTGREALLGQLFQAIRERLAHPGIFNHWLLTGSRGAGKSFFLRLLQTTFAAAIGPQARFVLLPEEHRNIYAPHEFLAEVQRMLTVEQGAIGAAPVWRIDDSAKAWQEALHNLLKAFPEQLLVIGVENFDQLIEQAFSDETDNSRLRHLMSNETRIMLIATAVQGDFDEKYNQRLFRQFEHHPIPRWDSGDHRDYLERRAKKDHKIPTPQQLARIDAYSRYTGGNARAAAVLAGAILDEHDPLHAAEDLDAAIEKMSDYYRALIDRIPINTRKLLDALIRGGEPASQTEIAERTGARQNDISRAFMWLVDQGYVSESRLPGQKTKQYRVLDRLFVQFYRMRSVSPGQRSKLALMADLLSDTLAFEDKLRFAIRYDGDGHSNEARTLLELAFRDRTIDINRLSLSSNSHLCKLGQSFTAWDTLFATTGIAEQYQEIVNRYPTDQSFIAALEEATALVRAANDGDTSGEDFVQQLENYLTIYPIEKLYMLRKFLTLEKDKRTRSGALIVREFSVYGKDENESKRLKEKAELDRQFPRTASLEAIANKINEGHKNFQGLGFSFAASWSAEAVSTWATAGHIHCARRAFLICAKSLANLLTSTLAANESLEIIQQLEVVAAKTPFGLSALIQRIKGDSLEQLNRHEEAYKAFNQARIKWHSVKLNAAASRALGSMAWSQSRMGNIEQASIEHRQAYDELIKLDKYDEAAWNLGQLARYTAITTNVSNAWLLLDAEAPYLPGQMIMAIEQLGDAVADVADRLGEPSAFVFGCTLLQGLADRPQYSTQAALRALWIDMIEMVVPHRLLRDLLAEWPRLFGLQYSELHSLKELLLAWLDDLDTPPAERISRRLTLDPDLATTLTALAEGLSVSTKTRLELNEPASALSALPS